MVIIFISSVICAFQFEELLHANSRIPSIPSPDGKHIVVVRWFMPGALGDDYVHISLRKKWSPIATEVESGGGEPPNDPTVRWIDSQRLVISYWSKGEIKPCSSSIREVDGVEILCQE